MKSTDISDICFMIFILICATTFYKVYKIRYEGWLRLQIIQLNQKQKRNKKQDEEYTQVVKYAYAILAEMLYDEFAKWRSKNFIAENLKAMLHRKILLLETRILKDDVHITFDDADTVNNVFEICERRYQKELNLNIKDNV